MSRLVKSARAKPGSNSHAGPLPKAAPPSPQFTESQQSSQPDPAESSPDRAERRSPAELSLEATEPFPPDLFRVPVPNAVFSRMSAMSDSALRCLLALIHLSFRFDPEQSEWVCPKRQFTRGDVEEACGLSSQGTRNGLSELDTIGWVCVDRSGRSHRHKLLLSVPTQRFTYVPSALLENARDLESGAELRVALAVLRGTWGWTGSETDPQSGDKRVVHDRWVQLSNRQLAEATGRSETAVAEAATALQGAWIERVRPGHGAYQYRFLPESVENGPEGSNSFSGSTANDLTPYRQKSGTPTFNKESFLRDKHSQYSERGDPHQETEVPPDSNTAVPSGTQPHEKSAAKDTARAPAGQSTAPDFSNLSPEKRDLAEKLQNVGVWAGRIAEFLSRFSPARIRANFELYRRRAAQQTIRRPGAWLSQAIAEGYALPAPSTAEPSSSSMGGTLPPLEHKQTVSESEKEAYIAQGIDEDRFHRCLSGRDDTTGPRFMYFAPDTGGPSARR